MKPKLYALTLTLSAALLVAAEPTIVAPGLPFATPDQAVTAVHDALAAKDRAKLRAIFGPSVDDIVNPDEVQAMTEFETVLKAMNQSKKLLEAGAGRMKLEYGEDKTVFPVPLVKSGGQWYFDTAAGKEELINRRIGRNELEALDAIRAYIQAQREYASQDRDGDEVLEYAQRFGSTPGKKDGLFWRPDLDGTLSPLGPLVADAEAEGYIKKTAVERQPFRGYYFKILTRQEKNAAGGAYNYIINGNMIGGFALVAWPAEYDETGVMSFIVNQQGRVYQKDLGTNTSKIAEAMKGYDPDSTWTLSVD